jgi:hypothetical protein
MHPSRHASLEPCGLSSKLCPPSNPVPHPDGEVHLPFPGGGINDVLARILGDRLQANWAQPVVIENKMQAIPTMRSNGHWQMHSALRCCRKSNLQHNYWARRSMGTIERIHTPVRFQSQSEMRPLLIATSYLPRQ